MSDQNKTPDFSSLTENLTQQQAKISALKELVRQSETQQGRSTASAQEKVKNIAQRLSNLKSKTSKSKYHQQHLRAGSEISDDYQNITHFEEDESETTPSSSSSTVVVRAKSETPGSEKFTLLRKQMELNRLKMAERESRSKEIEHMVTQLKSQFESSQMSLEKSVELGRSMGDLSTSTTSVVPSMLLNTQHRSTSQLPLSTIGAGGGVSLVENERIKFLEKRIRELEMEKSTFNESDVIVQMERKILDLEESIREKDCIIEARTKAVSLLSEDLSKKKKDVVDSLEDTKQEMFKMQEAFLDAELTYKREVSKLNRAILEKSDEIKNLNEKCEILEKSRYDLTIENSELKGKLEDVQDYSTKISELNKLNESLQKRISSLEGSTGGYEFINEEEAKNEALESKIKVLEALLSETKNDEKINELEKALKSRDEEIEQLQESLQEKTVEVDVVNANMQVLQEKYNSLSNSKPLFTASYDASEETHAAELTKLRQQLDDANKSGIKTKLKIKQMQKQIDTLQKSSDGKEEINRLNEEIQALTQKIAELEEEKGSYQLQLETAEKVPDTDNRISELEKTCAENEEKIRQLLDEKEEINSKMNQYLNENMELLDKLEKISKGSSAESIEMVANLTAQEKLEIEEYQKGIVLHKDEEIPPEIGQELNESLKSLRLESSELMEKIELFTVERREVLEKLDSLTIENHVLSGNLEHVKEEKLSLENENDKLKKDIESFEKSIDEYKADKEEMTKRLGELSDHRTQLQEEINKLVRSELSPQSSPSKVANEPSSVSGSTLIDRDACEKLLKNLDSEIQNLHKNKDKNQKLKISKKLSDNAKNVHAMMTNLLTEFYKNLDECKQLRDDLEKVKILLNTTNRNDEENLEKKLNESLEKLSKKSQECEELEKKLIEINVSNNENIETEIQSLKSQIEIMSEESNEKDNLIKKMSETVDTLTKERDHCEEEVKKQMTLVSDLRHEFDQLCADVKVNNQRLNEKSTELDHLQHEFDMRLKTSTNEVEILKTLVAEQKQLLIDAYQEHELDINQKIKEIEEYQKEVKKLKEELEAIQSQSVSNQEAYAIDLRVEINKMKELLAESNKEIENQREELLHKQETIDTLNTQIIDLYKSMEENSNKLIEKEDEIQYLQEISDTNKDDIRKAYEKISSADKIIADLKNQLSEKVHEIELLQQKPPSSKNDERIKQLETLNELLEAKSREQLDKLKKYAANLKKKTLQCTELEEKIASSSEMSELKAKVIQYEEQLHLIKIENSKLNESAQKSSASDEMDDLRWKIDEYESMIEEKSKKIEDLERKVAMTASQCDQMEESSYELQSQLQKMENEKNSLSKTVEELQNELSAVKDELNATKQHDEGEKSDDRKKMEKVKAAAVQLKHKLTEKKKEVEDLQAEIAILKSNSISSQSSHQEVDALRHQIKELDEMNEKILSETKIAYEHDIGMLRQQINELEASNRLLVEDKQRKVSLEGQLETFEMTNIELREKVARLEENVADYEVEKNAILREKLALEKELEEKVIEVACNEDIYNRHVNNLIAQDALIGTKLRETEAENYQLCETIKELEVERNVMIMRFNSIEAQAATLSNQNVQQINSLENDNKNLESQIEQLQNELKILKTSHEQALAVKHAEIDEMEAELSSQLQKIESEKKSIQEALEKANDQIVDFQDEVVRLKENNHTLEQARADLEREMSWLKLQSENYTQDQLEIEQLRMQLMQSETELENLRSQNETMLSNHQAEVIILQQQISDLETMRSQVSQNQTDDQVMLHNENIRLKELLVEKENIIQQKAMQIQLFDAPIQAVNDPFANLAAAPSTHHQQQQQQRNGLEEELERAREAHIVANMELDVQSGRIQELLNENKKLNEKITEMQLMMDNLIKTNSEVSERQMIEIIRKETEINEIKTEMEALRNHYQVQSTDDDKLHPLQSELAEKNRAIENLQIILKKYENVQAPPQQTVSTAIFFDDPQPSTSSLFDDPFSNVQPVVEEEIVPKTAYLCYDSTQNGTQTEEQWLKDHQDFHNQISLLQQQLQAMETRYMEQCMEIESQRQHICELETFKKRHEHAKSLNLVEEEIVPKKAYLCYDDDHQSLEAKIESLKKQIAILENEKEHPGIAEPSYVTKYFGDDQQQPSMEALEIDDAWGWSGGEIQQVTSLLSPKSDLEVRLQEQKDLVDHLEKEKNALNEELLNLRENSKKMIKKLKEYQLKIKEVETRRSSSVESDMDLVIQEELNSQIQKLEGKLKEINAEREKEHQERDNLNKKLEVLSNANDRMLEMKERQDSQMEMYQLKIRDLSQKLQNLEEWGDDESSNKNVEMSPTKENQIELTNKIKELTDQIRDIQVDYDEGQAMLEEEKNNNKILEEKLQSKTSEINELLSKIDQFSRESSNIKSILDDLRSQVQEKTNENQQLNDRLQKLAANNDEFSQYGNQQIHEMENQIQNLQGEIQYKDAMIQEANEKNNELIALKEEILNKSLEISSLKSQLDNQPIPQDANDIQQKLIDYEKKIGELMKEKQQMEHELQVLNDQVLASLEFEDRMKNTVLELDAKNIEIQMLKSTLDKMQSNSTSSSDDTEQLRHEKEELERSIDLINAQWSQMVEQRGAEVANSWKQHLEMREAEFAEIESNYQKQLAALPQTAVPEDVLKMKSIMESQEVEIVSLKEQLAIRSAEFAALSARVDPYNQMSTSMSVSPIPHNTESDKVPRSELDLALYMLHQREMRLEEMTLELVRLLEERDTLQLRLSNAIRQIEEIKKKFNIEGESSDQSTPEKLPGAVNVEDDQLKAKLSQLNTIRHLRDKGIAEDREKRFMENISLFQRDVANIPPEAAARIVSGTTEPGQQSPSSVLMNWILGTKPSDSPSSSS